jgi:hypothetical protein
MNREEIATANKAIRETMDMEVNIHVPELVLEKLNKLSNVLGLSSQCIADSEKLYNDKIGELILAKEYKSMQITDKKLLFQSLASEHIQAMNYSVQLNKDLHYCVESCRSMLSYIKSEMEQSLRAS